MNALTPIPRPAARQAALIAVADICSDWYTMALDGRSLFQRVADHMDRHPITHRAIALHCIRDHFGSLGDVALDQFETEDFFSSVARFARECRREAAQIRQAVTA